MQLRFASYNIHKGVGSDRRRDPDRIIAVIGEIEADVIALQEVDRRFGTRQSVLGVADLLTEGWQIVGRGTRPASMGWHGNALLVRRGTAVLDVATETLPRFEPRGAIRAMVEISGQRICVTGMHLDLTGLRRKRQFAHLCSASRAPGLPAVMLGDCNEWIRPIGGDRGLAAHWHVVAPGRSFPAIRPLLSLDRVLHTDHWRIIAARVHDTPLARKASDHLPIYADLTLAGG